MEKRGRTAVKRIRKKKEGTREKGTEEEDKKGYTGGQGVWVVRTIFMGEDRDGP